MRPFFSRSQKMSQFLAYFGWALAGVCTLWLGITASPAFFALFVAFFFPLYGAWTEEKRRQRQAAAYPRGRVSALPSALVVWRYDHDADELDGTLLDGAFKGWRLKELDPEDLQKVREVCRVSGAHELALYDAWLDKHGPVFWRRDFTATTTPLPMPPDLTRAEAGAILGVMADQAAVVQAVKRLLVLHAPNRGGSAYVCVLVKKAGEVLAQSPM